MKQDNSSGYAAVRNGAGVAAVSTGRLLMRGADRREYLQGLLTNDIGALTPGTGCYAAMLTAQGRMITDMRVLELGDAVLLDLPRAVTGAVRDHFERFVFSEDVQVDDVTESIAADGLYGPRSLDALLTAGLEGSSPTRLNDSIRVQIAGRPVTLVRSDTFGVSGFDLLTAPVDRDAVLGAVVAAGAVPTTAADVEAIRVESGRPLFGVDMDADTIPLEAGIEGRAISRSKGCYVGQEVIVRVQDRGHGRVARRLVGLTFDPAAAVPTSGAAVRAGDRDIGRVTSAVWSPSLARPIALGYVHRDFVDEGRRVSVGDVEAIVSALPFVK